MLGSLGIIYLKLEDKLNNILTNHYNLSCSHIGVYANNEFIITNLYENITSLSDWEGPFLLKETISKYIDTDITSSDNIIKTEISKIVICKCIYDDKILINMGEEFIKNKLKISNNPRNELRIFISDIEFQLNDTRINIFPKKNIIYDVSTPVKDYDIESNFRDLIFLKQSIKDEDPKIQSNLLWSQIRKFNILVNDYVKLSKYIKSSLLSKKFNLKSIPKIDYNDFYMEYPENEIDTSQIIKKDSIARIYEEPAETHKLDIYLNQLYDELNNINLMILDNQTPIINYRNLIDIYNNLCKLSNSNKTINIPVYNRSVGSSIILPTVVSEISLKKGDKIIIPSLNPDLKNYSVDQLNEIKLYLDINSCNNPYFDELRDEISKIIHIKRKSN